MRTNYNDPRSRARGWFNRLTRVQKLLAALASLVITSGAVASAVTAVLDLSERLGGDDLGIEARDFVPQVITTAKKWSATPKPRIEVPRYGARVTALDRNSPASSAGLKVADLITAVNGRKVQDVDAESHPGNPVRCGSLLLWHGVDGPGWSNSRRRWRASHDRGTNRPGDDSRAGSK
jgi:PDZ domain